MATTVTDAKGHYAFSGIAAGPYSVGAAVPDGDLNTTPTTVAVAMAAGGTATANFGDKVNPSPSAAAIPATTSVNIVLRGQSNAYFLETEGYVAKLQTAIQNDLGFDGINQTVNFIADTGKTDGTNTLNPGTGLVKDWLSPIGGNYQNGWTAQPLELGLLSDLAQQSAAVKAAPTLVLYLQNENDSTTDGLTAAEWESAVQYEAGLVRTALGQSASAVPYLFVNAIPFPVANFYPDQTIQTPAAHDIAEQSIKIGMAALSADPAFDAAVAAQESDVAMNQDLYDNYNLGAADQQQLVNRLALSIANELSASALPGSPLALANGHQDSLGPQVIAATTVVGQPNQVLLTIKQDTATGFAALNSVAAAGIAWSIRNDAVGSDTVLEASGTAAQIVDGTHLLITFDQAVPANGDVFYDWGAGRIAPSSTAPGGNGDAVYDTNNLPIWANPNGVPITPSTGSIAGTVFFDVSGNNVFGGSDVGFASAQVSLLNGSGSVVATATTNASGAYSFANVAVGTYTVSFGSPNSIFVPTGAPTASVIVAGGQAVSGISAGFYYPVGISGTAFKDANGNGTLDAGETGVAGETVTLVNSANAVVSTVTTGANGAYSFTALKPGTYSLRFAAPAGYVLTTPATTNLAALTSGGSVIVNSGDLAAVGSIAGTVFFDVSGNNVFGGSDVGFSGSSVSLLNGSGSVVATATTNASGAYIFANVAVGTYTVSFGSPSSIFVPTGATTTSVTVAGGQAVGGISAGFYYPAGISGTAFKDANGNGTLDNGETGVAGETVTLLNSANAVVSTVTTGANGTYSFGVKPGTYSLGFTAPTGYALTTATKSVGAVTSGANVTVNSALHTPVGSIGGTIFFDVTGTNVFGGSDVGFSGSPVSLLNGSGAVVTTTTTNASGVYSFANVAAGTYTVSFGSPNSIFVPTGATTASVTIADGQAVTGVSAGFYYPAGISGTAFKDTNGNGTLDAGEAGVAGETVTLLGGNNNVVSTLTTGTNGIYSFGVKPGSYSLHFSPPTGYSLTTPAASTTTVTSGANVTINSGLNSMVQAMATMASASSSTTTMTQPTATTTTTLASPH